ncbi:LOW QUALITY PROTEIN: fibronectin type III domain-containing protein 11 [Trichosurus vulpecula]|uniref:LOW QUALITY PROTEIN: fibronectin type III domain-containing protein 11 n=1 Tax=Trichosurus vulpecula TaxID=9337 RepID=UPI00186B1308|nr:LOW QUALITY PROTEIN: fibronectin type III domain-containing protein 11 [Trichosurus vulpecula]
MPQGHHSNSLFSLASPGSLGRLATLQPCGSALLPRLRQVPRVPSLQSREKMSFGAMDLGLNRMKLGSPQSLQSLEEEQQPETEAWRTYTDRRNILREFLTSDLSPHLLKRHHARMELLKKCSYYIEILPKHLALGDQNPLMLPSTMFQLIDPWKFQRMKKVGTAQTKIQLLLLSDLLEQLDRGRAKLVALLESHDMLPFLSCWDTVEQRLADLSAVMDNFLAMMVPGRLHIKHRLVSDIGATKIPHIRLMLSTKMPVMFDRKESVAHHDWASLRWFVTIQPTVPEQFELRFKLLEPRSQQERVQCGVIPVATCTFDIRNLLPSRTYKFTVKRAESYTLVYEPWRDSLTLKTKPAPPDGAHTPESRASLACP